MRFWCHLSFGLATLAFCFVPLLNSDAQSAKVAAILPKMGYFCSGNDASGRSFLFREQRQLIAHGYPSGETYYSPDASSFINVTDGTTVLGRTPDGSEVRVNFAVMPINGKYGVCIGGVFMRGDNARLAASLFSTTGGSGGFRTFCETTQLAPGAYLQLTAGPLELSSPSSAANIQCIFGILESD